MVGKKMNPITKRSTHNNQAKECLSEREEQKRSQRTTTTITTRQNNKQQKNEHPNRHHNPESFCSESTHIMSSCTICILHISLFMNLYNACSFVCLTNNIYCCRLLIEAYLYSKPQIEHIISF